MRVVPPMPLDGLQWRLGAYLFPVPFFPRMFLANCLCEFVGYGTSSLSRVQHERIGQSRSLSQVCASHEELKSAQRITPDVWRRGLWWQRFLYGHCDGQLRRRGDACVASGSSRWISHVRRRLVAPPLVPTSSSAPDASPVRFRVPGPCVPASWCVPCPAPSRELETTRDTLKRQRSALRRI